MTNEFTWHEPHRSFVPADVSQAMPGDMFTVGNRKMMKANKDSWVVLCLHLAVPVSNKLVTNMKVASTFLYNTVNWKP